MTKSELHKAITTQVKARVEPYGLLKLKHPVKFSKDTKFIHKSDSGTIGYIATEANEFVAIKRLGTSCIEVKTRSPLYECKNGVVYKDNFGYTYSSFEVTLSAVPSELRERIYQELINN